MSNNNIQKVSIRFFNDREVRAVWDETLSVIKLMFSTQKAFCPRVSLGLSYAMRFWAFSPYLNHMRNFSKRKMFINNRNNLINCLINDTIISLYVNLCIILFTSSINF